LRRLQERVTSLRDRTVETVRTLSFAAVEPEGGSPAHDPRRHSLSSERHRTPSEVLIASVPLDTSVLLASPQVDVLTVTYVYRHWMVLRHAIDADLARLDIALSRAANPLKAAAAAAPAPAVQSFASIAPILSAIIGDAAPADSEAAEESALLAPVVVLESDSVLSEEADPTDAHASDQPTVVHEETVEVSDRVPGLESTTVLPVAIAVDAAATIHASVPVQESSPADAGVDPQALVRTTSTETLQSTGSVDPVLVVDSPLAAPLPPPSSERRRLSLADLGIAEGVDASRSVPPSLPGSHAFLPSGLQSTAVTVYNNMLSSAIAYSLSSAMYWKQMGEIMDYATARFKDLNVLSGDERYASRLLALLLCPVYYECVGMR
jgi:hypothetical protein